MNELQVRNSEKPERKLNTITKKKKWWFSGFVFIVPICIIYLIVNIFIGFGNSYSIYTINHGEYEDIITTKGYIFREQVVINAPESGYLDCRVSENERVASGAEIASIYSKMPDESIVANLKKIDEEISDLSAVEIKDTAYSANSKNTESYADEIKSAVAFGYSKDFEGISGIAKEMVRNIRKSNLTNSNSSETEKNSSDSVEETMIAELKAQREKIISENGLKNTSIISGSTGVFSSKIDGFEESLKVERLDGITPSYLKGLGEDTSKAENNVQAGAPVCKIINNFEWYCASVVPADSVRTLSVNQNVELRFFDITSDTITGTITYISPEENGEVVVVVKSNKYVDSIYTMSKADVDIVKHTYSGLKIPKNGIRVVEDKTGIYVLRNGIAKFVNVEVIYSNSDWAIISENTANNEAAVKIYDELILDAKNLYHGKIIE